VIFSVVYLLACCLLGCMMVLARREASRDAELLVLRHENAVLRRQIGRVRYQPADRLWLAALSAGRERAPAIRDHHERIGDRDVGPPCRTTRTARRSRRGGEPGPRPSSGGARRTRSPGRTADGTGASPGHVGTDHLDGM